MYPTMFNRDEIFFRLGSEKSEELLELIKNAEDPNFQDTKGFSYLHRACHAHYIEAIKILLERGADPNINDVRGKSPVMESLGSINDKNPEILELMLQYGLDLDKKERDKTLKEKIEDINREEYNSVISKYYHK